MARRSENLAGGSARHGWRFGPPIRQKGPVAFIAACVCTAVPTVTFTIRRTRSGKCAPTRVSNINVTLSLRNFAKIPRPSLSYHRQTRQPLSFEANRVYLAAGVVPTTKILLRSQNAYDRPVRARDSQYFLFPLLMARRVRDVRNEPAYTLSQLFIELNNQSISRHTVHLQIYTYNEIIARTVQKSLGPLKMFARPIEERILIVQCFLHSDDSPEIEMTLKRDGQKDVLLLETRPNPVTRRVVRRTLREFLRNAPQLGAIPLIPMLELMRPGQGFHSGGTFPMRAQPKAFESDSLGRPRGWARVHAVDATVFPSVPATTITLPVMANAHRIGWETAGMI
jgi:hypothetical protein